MLYLLRYYIHRFLLTFAVIVGGMAILTMILGRFSEIFWFFDNFSLFYLQYGIILAFCFGIFLVKRKWIHATVVLIPILLIISFQVPPSTAQGSDLTQETTLERPVGIFLSNVLYTNTHFDKVKDEIHSYNPDIIVLQETNEIWEENLTDIIEEFPYGLNITNRGYSSMIVRSKIPIKEAVNHSEFDTPVIELIFENFSVITAHPQAPTTQAFYESRNTQLEGLSKLLEKRDRAVLIGDLNTNIYSPYFYPFLKYHTSQYGIPNYLSWPTQFGIGAATLDHALIKNFEAKSFERGKNIGSDHWPFFLTVQ